MRELAATPSWWRRRRHRSGSAWAARFDASAPLAGIKDGVDQACLWSLPTSLIRSKNPAAFATIQEHIALFNECVRLHLNNELRQ